VRENLKRSYEVRKKAFDKHTKPPNFHVGDVVYVNNPVGKPGTAKGLNPKWTGPWRVVALKSPVTIEITEIQGKRTQVVHANRLKLSTEIKEPPTSIESEQNSDADSEQSDLETTQKHVRTDKANSSVGNSANPVDTDNGLEDIIMTIPRPIVEPPQRKSISKDPPKDKGHAYRLRSIGAPDSHPWVIPKPLPVPPRRKTDD
jgi:hypothetical protein